VDFFPTFLDAAGARIPPGKELDGESLVPLLKGGAVLRRKSLFWHFPGYLDDPVMRGRERDVAAGFRSRPVSVVRAGDWKLHLHHEEWQLDGGRARLETNEAVELYRLDDNIGERINLAATHPAKRDELLDHLLAWLGSTRAPLPTEPNPAYDPSVRSTKEPKPERRIRTKAAQADL
jgi:arylsulfatase A-like enzyme